jgi:hypothetical protein
MYFKPIITSFLTILEGLVNLPICILGLSKFWVDIVMKWLVYCSVKEYEAYNKQKISEREIKEKEAKQLAQMAINLSHGKDIQE